METNRHSDEQGQEQEQNTKQPVRKPREPYYGKNLLNPKHMPDIFNTLMRQYCFPVQSGKYCVKFCPHCGNDVESTWRVFKKIKEKNCVFTPMVKRPSPHICHICDLDLRRVIIKREDDNNSSGSGGDKAK